MDPITQQQALAAAGAAAGPAGPGLYVDEVFSTYLITGTGSAQTINVGIDFSGEGGLVWFKNRDTADSGRLVDSERGGPAKTLSPDNTTGEASYGTNVFGGFTSTGYITGDAGMSGGTGEDAVYWGFRKAPGFFDVVTYTGNGSIFAPIQNVAHSLGSEPGFIMVKATSGTGNWICYHRSLTQNNSIVLNSTDAEQGYQRVYIQLNSTTHFTVRDQTTGPGSANKNGVSYVAYLFAHDDQSFGTNSNEAIIKCGSYTGNASTNGPTVDLGFEPQWIMIKNADTSADWVMHDSMRGIAFGGNDARLMANENGAETSGDPFLEITPTGFKVVASGVQYNGSNDNMTYVAIRRPHKPPTAGTDVLDIVSGTNSNPYLFSISLLYADTVWNKKTSGSGSWMVTSRLTGMQYFNFDTVNARSYGSASNVQYDYNYKVNPYFWSSGTQINYILRRFPGVLDVVGYTGDGTDNREISHNLGSAAEFIVVKATSTTGNWICWHKGLTQGYSIVLNSTAAQDGYSRVNNHSNSTTHFRVRPFTSGPGSANTSGVSYVAYLFASLDEISKVGTYSGSGNDVNVDCGFTSGARFVLIKRLDSTGDWYAWDTERGIVSGNDDYILFNDDAAEVTSTDYIDPLNAGFTVTSSAPAALNASGGSYLFLAIA